MIRILVAILAALAPAWALAAETVIDDFESAGSPAPWVFGNGPEFPGATGSLTLGPGHVGKGAHLAFDLTQGSYVQASRTLSPALAAKAIGVWARSPGGIQVVLRVVDEGDQTLQYRAARPLQAHDPAAWYRLVVDLASPEGHWGGANDGTVHGFLKGVAILAADPMPDPQAKVGAIDLDDVVAIDALSASLDPFHDPLDPPPAPAMDLSQGVGVNIHFTKDDQALDAAKAAGLGWVRMDFSWGGTERTSGVYDFTAYDALMSSLQKRGMSALFILDYANSLHQDCADCAPASAATVKAFGDWCQAAALHFAGKPVRWEVWNEPNLAQFWKPAPNPTDYGALLKEAIARLHQGDPKAEVSSGGTSTLDLAFLRGALANGNGLGAAAVGVHPYRSGGPETLPGEYLLLRTVIGQLVPDVPIWDTEWGYSSAWFGDGHDATNRQRQAIYVVREILVARALGFPLAIYYDLRDDGTDPSNAEHNFGLLANDYSDKPAMQGMRYLLGQVAGRTYAGALSTSPGSVHALRLDGASDVLLLVWLEQTNQTMTVQLPAVSLAVNMFGQPHAVSVVNGKTSIDLAELEGPVYLTFKAPGADAGLPGPDSAVPPDATAPLPDAAAADVGTGSDASAPSDATNSADAALVGLDASSSTDAAMGPPATAGCSCSATSPLSALAGLAGLALLRRRRR
jgi:uncharacterized protein (TIGR03382 family)